MKDQKQSSKPFYNAIEMKMLLRPPLKSRFGETNAPMEAVLLFTKAVNKRSRRTFHW
jgi:hypothetical protein